MDTSNPVVVLALIIGGIALLWFIYVCLSGTLYWLQITDAIEKSNSPQEMDRNVEQVQRRFHKKI